MLKAGKQFIQFKYPFSHPHWSLIFAWVICFHYRFFCCFMALLCIHIVERQLKYTLCLSRLEHHKKFLQSRIWFSVSRPSNEWFYEFQAKYTTFIRGTSMRAIIRHNLGRSWKWFESYLCAPETSKCFCDGCHTKPFGNFKYAIINLSVVGITTG